MTEVARQIDKCETIFRKDIVSFKADIRRIFRDGGEIVTGGAFDTLVNIGIFCLYVNNPHVAPVLPRRAR